MREPPARPQPPSPDTMPYRVAADLAGVRDFVRACAGMLGLPGSRGDLLALAVSELATNTLQHTDNGGTVRVWASAGQVICDVIDRGAMRSFGAMPAPDSARGRGLAIVKQIVDQVVASATVDGTLVRIRMNL